MMIKDKQICHHGRTIDGTFYSPEGVEKFPVIIFSHGYNGCKTDWDGYARYFASNGVGAFCYTFCGGSTRDTSGFPTTEMTVFTEKEDLSAIIDEVSTWENVDKDHLFLFGGSQGGFVSALVAEDRGKKIKGLVLLFPALCIPDNWRDRFKTREEIPDTEEFWGMTLGRAFFEAIYEFRVEEQIGSYEGPVLIMHGTEDAIVPACYSSKAKERYLNARLELFQGEGHGFSEEGDNRAEGMTMYFVHGCMEQDG